MNKIKLSDKFIQFCKKNGQIPEQVYLLQCSYLVNESCVNILFEGLNGDLYDRLDRMLLREDELTFRKDIVFFWEEDSVEVKEDKSKSTFNELVKRLSKLNVEITAKFGYFYGSAANKTNAKHAYEQGNFDLEKSLKIIESYYTNWDSDIKVKSLWNLLVSDDWVAQYNNFKESKTAFDKYE